MSKKIMIDAGHYTDYNRSCVYSKYCEGNMTWKLQKYLKEELESYGFIVSTTRKSRDKDLELFNRGYKSKGYDLFLSLHSNAAEVESVDRVVVIKGYDQPNTLAKKLAIAISDVMPVTQNYQIYTRQKSNKEEWYGVLRGAKAAGVANRFILEHGFHTNTKIAKWLYKDENLKKLAKAEAKVIADYYNYSKNEKNKIEDKKVYNCDVKVICNEDLNVREARPEDDKLAAIKFTLPKGTIVKLGYVLNGWGSIYTSNNYGYVNVKYLELI